jgi:hypothetical protein
LDGRDQIALKCADSIEHLVIHFQSTSPNNHPSRLAK